MNGILRNFAWVMLLVVTSAGALSLGLASNASASGPRADLTPTATPARVQAGDLIVETTCTPSFLRLNESSAVDCITTVSNVSEQALPPVRLNVVPATTGPAIDYALVWTEVDGERQPVAPVTVPSSGEPLAPGQTAESRSILVMTPRGEGVSRSRLEVASPEGEVIASVPVVFTVGPHLTDVPELDVEIWPSSSSESDPAAATFLLTAINSSPDDMTDVKLYLRYENAEIKASTPEPAFNDAALGLASWDVSSLVTEDVDREVAQVEVTITKERCVEVPLVLLVEATISGELRRYGEIWSTGMSCAPTPALTPSATAEQGATPAAKPDQSSVSPPLTGEREAPGSGTLPGLILIVATGVGLVGLGLVLRRRSNF